MKSRAICIVGPRAAELRDIEVRELEPHEVLVESMASGICAWDIKVFAGDIAVPYPYVGGHESVGRVVAKGTSVVELEIGDIVTTWPKKAFSEYYVVASDHAVKIGTGCVDPKRWICEPQKCAVTAATQLGIVPGDTVALIGCGYMGLLHMQVLPREWVSCLVAIDLSEQRLELARMYGADHVIAARPGREPEVAREVLALCQEGVDIVIEATGVPNTLDLAAQIVRPGGTVSVFGLHSRPEPLDTYLWHVKGLRLLSTSPQISTSPVRDFRRAVELTRKGVFDQASLITHEFDFADGPAVLELLALRRPPEYLKGVFTFGRS